jgi:hypothetical protein
MNCYSCTGSFAELAFSVSQSPYNMKSEEEFEYFNFQLFFVTTLEAKCIYAPDYKFVAGFSKINRHRGKKWPIGVT